VSLEGSSIKVAHYREPEEGLIQVRRQNERRIGDEALSPIRSWRPWGMGANWKKFCIAEISVCYKAK
jgi:hypothetical protein